MEHSLFDYDKVIQRMSYIQVLIVAMNEVRIQPVGPYDNGRYGALMSYNDPCHEGMKILAIEEGIFELMPEAMEYMNTIKKRCNEVAMYVLAN
jgi:hypothetical protein